MSTVEAKSIQKRMSSRVAVLETQALTRRFGSLTAVDNFTVEILGGEMFGLVGPNGAGKSTVIKMLTTLLPPTSGNASIAGYDILHHPSQVRRVIGYVPQLLSADGSLTGYENLLIFAKLYSLTRDERKERVQEALDFMGLTEVADRLVRNYSGGMIRRLEIAQSMLHRPKVLFLDEPTVGLDPIARGAVWAHIEKLRDNYGTTILLTTHYMEEADALCTRVAIMHLGKVVAIGTPTALKSSVSPGATLNDVFTHYAGYELESTGNFRDVSRTRRTAQRLA
ncbi:MAG TPA: ATP-binding cassette domain-containing protein [Candidatus Saccharimonadales bacterium]|nr:ATP-binding cassette domain-containing protein [Candidatus Saccharimonadales bacterium]